MSELVLGTDEGVFAFHLDSGKLQEEDGPEARVTARGQRATRCTPSRTIRPSGAGAGTTTGSL